MLTERETKIGARLRAFRELLQIPRTKFAVSIGFGGERMAAYEAGRARLPYLVFQAVAARYDLYPRWLAEGEGSPQVKDSFDDRAFAAGLPRHALFTEVYDGHLARRLTAATRRLGAEAESAAEMLRHASALLRQVDTGKLTAAQRRKLGEFNRRQARLIRQVKADLGLRESVNARAARASGRARRT